MIYNIKSAIYICMYVYIYIVLNETWRDKTEEIWTTSGHLFLGSGGISGSCGVAIILNKRWVSDFRGFAAISERICFLDVDIRGRHIRLIAVYMPTSWSSDGLVEAVYAELTNLCLLSRKANRAAILFFIPS